jgi:O-antigen ligase
MELGWGLTGLFTQVLYVCSLAVILLTLFYRIEFGIFFLAFFLPLQNILNYTNIYPFGKDINDLVLLSLIIRWIYNKKRDGKKLFEPSPVYLPLILLAIWTYVGIWRGSFFLNLPLPLQMDHPLVVEYKNFWIPMILFLVVFNNLSDSKQRKWLVLALALSILVLDRNFYNIMSQHDTSHYSDALKDKLGGTSAALTGNVLAVFLAQYAIILLALFFQDISKWRKIYWGSICALSYYCVLFLFSRGGYLAAGVSAATLGVLKHRIILLLLVLVYLFYTFLLPPAVIERLEMTQTEDGYDNSVMERIGMWDQAKQMIAESPIWGWGFAITILTEVRAGEQYQNQVWHSFHNNYLQTAVETGLVGLALMLWLFGMGIKCGWQLYRTSDDSFEQSLGLGMICCVMGILAGNLNGSYWHYYSVASFYWIFLALVQKQASGEARSEQAPVINEQGESPAARFEEIKTAA